MKTLIKTSAVALVAAGIGIGSAFFGQTEQASQAALAASGEPGSTFFRAFVNDKLVSSENGSNNGMNCNRDGLGAWERFELDLVDGGVSICGNNGKFVSSENGNRSMRCNRNAVGAWEVFDIEDREGRRTVLKGNNGKYVSSEDARQPMRCNRNGVGSWEEFFSSIAP